MKNIRPIAIYLPQYHPFKENNEWWGEGFTEWNNVVKGKPRFNGHYQPHLPADLGFYDLRLPEVREKQAAMAKEYGIYGFCYYHYWFNGKLLMERPLNEILESGKPDFPFCMCWANENWSRRWDGGDHHILIAQDYSEQDDIEHIRYLLPIFRDERYIKVDGKPLFIVYKPDEFPNIQRTIQIWREEAKKEGIELYLCAFERVIGMTAEEECMVGFDAAIEFQPLSKALKKYSLKYHRPNIFERVINKIQKIYCQIQNKERIRKKDNHVDYEIFIDMDLQMTHDCKCYPGVSPSWDNSSRRTKIWATIFKGSTPDLFHKWTSKKIEQFTPFSAEENFLFINAWNEWAEGNHLEPDQKWGKQYLEALKKALNG